MIFSTARRRAEKGEGSEEEVAARAMARVGMRRGITAPIILEQSGPDSGPREPEESRRPLPSGALVDLDTIEPLARGLDPGLEFASSGPLTHDREHARALH